MIDWNKLPTKFAIKFNPRPGDYRLVKGLGFAALLIWACVMGWMVVIDVYAWINGADWGEIVSSGSWFGCAVACCITWFRRLIG